MKNISSIQMLWVKRLAIGLLAIISFMASMIVANSMVQAASIGGEMNKVGESVVLDFSVADMDPDDLTWKTIGPYDDTTSGFTCTDNVFDENDFEEGVVKTSSRIEGLELSHVGLFVCAQASNAEGIVATAKFALSGLTDEKLLGNTNSEKGGDTSSEETPSDITKSGYNQSLIVILFSLGVGASIAMIGMWHNIRQSKIHLEE